MKDLIVIIGVVVMVVLFFFKPNSLTKQEVSDIITKSNSEEVNQAILKSTAEQLANACYTPKVWPLIVAKYQADQSTTTK